MDDVKAKKKKKIVANTNLKMGNKYVKRNEIEEINRILKILKFANERQKFRKKEKINKKIK